MFNITGNSSAPISLRGLTFIYSELVFPRKLLLISYIKGNFLQSYVRYVYPLPFLPPLLYYPHSKLRNVFRATNQERLIFNWSENFLSTKTAKKLRNTSQISFFP